MTMIPPIDWRVFSSIGSIVTRVNINCEASSHDWVLCQRSRLGKLVEANREEVQEK